MLDVLQDGIKHAIIIIQHILELTLIMSTIPAVLFFLESNE